MNRYAALTLIVGPAAGAALLVAAFTLLVRPALPIPTWSLDLIAIACGTVGLIAGGTIAAAQPIQATPPRRGWVLAGACCANAAAVTLVLLLAGVPVLSSYSILGIAAAAAFLLLVPGLAGRRR